MASLFTSPPRPSVFVRRGAPFALAMLLLGIGALLNLLSGTASVSADTLWHLLWSGRVDPGSTQAELAADVLWHIRAPRMFLGALVGAHLAVAGAILQGVLRNPLADSNILGIAAGASLLAVLLFLFAADDALVELWGHSVSALYLMPWVSTAGGLLAAWLVYRLSAAGTITPLRLILCGIAVASVLGALVTGILAGWGHANAETVLTWLAGTLYGRDWTHVQALLPWTLFGLLALPLLAVPLNLLQLDDATTDSLGLKVERWRGYSLALASILAASAVGMVGPIGFVGLLVPPVARRLAGADMRWQLPMSALLGALLVMAADSLARSTPGATELPVGILTSLLGVPFFVYVLRRQA